MKKYKIAFLFGLLSIALTPIYAQYGSGVDGAIADGSGTTYTDSKRLGLNANASAGQPTITVLSDATTTFANGDLCLVIQMIGTNAGRYEEKTISSRTATTITFTANLTYAYTDDGTTSQVAQVIKIPQYTNITLKTSGDVLTCNAYDGSTGGVCYFYASGTVDTDADGSITVAAKGFRGGSGAALIDATTSQYGKPGSRGASGGNNGSNGENVNNNCTPASGTGGGGAGGTSTRSGGAGGIYNGQSSSFSAVVAGTNSAHDGLLGSTGTSGEGPGAGTSSSSATNTSNSSNWGATSGTSILMGGGGAQGRQGLSSSRGGGGGGGAGNTVNGVHGSCSSGVSGPAGGTGGTGGGILVMKINTIQGTGAINVSGGNGSDGTVGSTGATGGNGGGGGGANTGGGGGGAGALGTSGSCPGHGGAAGSVWLVCGTCNTDNYSVSTSGGSKGAYAAGGTGGTGGNGANGGTAGNDQADDGQGGPGGYGGWSSDGCRGSAGSTAPASGAGKQTGAAGGAGGAIGCGDDSYCVSFGGGGGVALPIRLLSFTGHAKGGVNYLEWVTLTEINNHYFDVQRSADAVHFESLTNILGMGNHNGFKHYDHIDESPLNGINYYRLKQVDYDGKYTYSQTIAITQSGTSHIYAESNAVRIIVAMKSQLNVNILDITGKIIYSKNYGEVPQGIYDVDISEFANGIYVVNAQIGNKIQNIKFFK